VANTVIQLKKSTVPGNIPTSLATGEIAINTADGILFYKDPSEEIKSIRTGTSGNSYSTINVNSSLLIATSNSDILTITGDETITVTGDSFTDQITIGVRNSSTSEKGVVQLYDGVDSNSIFLAATANAVNAAYTLANAAYNATGSGSAILASKYKTEEYIATSGQTTFTVTGGYTPEYIFVYLNGVLLDTSDYIATNGSTVVLNSGAVSGDSVSIAKWFIGDSSYTYLSAIQTVDEFTATANQTTFYTVGNYTEDYIKVYRNGILLEKSEYSALGGTEVIIDYPIPENDIIAIEYWGANSIDATPVYIIANNASTVANNAASSVNNKQDKLEFGNITSNSVTTSTNTANQVLDLFSTTEYRSVKYQIQVTSSTDYQISEVILIHNGTNSYLTEYGLVSTNGSLMSYDTDINSGNTRLLMSPINNVNVIKIVKTLIEV
jgi:Phage tail fibre repeat